MSVTEEVTRIGRPLDERDIRTLTRVLIYEGCHGKRVILRTNRIYGSVLFVRGKVLERFCCGCSGSLARRVNCRGKVVVYVRDCFGRRPAHLVIRALRTSIM